jgi:tight adherence protein B
LIAGPILLVAAGLVCALALGTADRAVIARRAGHGVSSVHLRPRIPGLSWRWWPFVGAVTGLVAGGVITSLLAGIGTAILVGRLRRRRISSQASIVDDQLADAVRSIAAGMRAGLSVPQSIAYAAAESDRPLAGSFDRVVDRLEVGVGLEEALERWAIDVGTDDARLVVGVLALHRRTGGDLPLVLDQVAVTLRERVSAAREVRALTAQARLSGAILGLLPIGFFGFLWLTSRADIEGAFRSSIGIGSIVVGFVLETIAFLWIRSLLEVT